MILHDLYGDEVYREFSVNPIVSMWTGSTPVLAAASSSAGVLNEVNVNSLLLAALEQFKDQAALEQFEDQGATLCIGGIRRLRHNSTGARILKKTPAKMSTKYCL